MKTITAILTGIVSEAFEKCGYDAKLGNVIVSDRLDLCQFQCNGAFQGAKLYRKAPIIIAKEVAQVLSENPVFAKVEAVNPAFINMTVTDEYLSSVCAEIAEDEFCGIPQVEEETTVVIDYGGPNVAKPLHIGHLRSAVIGEALKRLARSCGMKVIGDVHLGDWGMPMGLVIAELMERNPDWACFKEDFDPAKDEVPTLDVNELNEIYPFASAKSKQDEAFKDKAHTITAQLQARKPGYYSLWKEIIRASVEDLKKSYEKLSVDFDYWYGESDADDYIPKLLKILEDKGLMYESDGAMIVDVAQETDKAPMPPVLIKKTDGSVLYDTTDLATIIQREEDFKPSDIWYVVDKRQALHFEQCFRCSKLAGLVGEDTSLEHLGFGTMNGSDGKPYKTRDGGVMQLSMLLDTAYNAAYERINKENFTSEEEISQTAQKLAIASIKFGDLINHRSKDYIFDLDKFLSAEGKTGAYLLYMVTRISSVLRKLEVCDEGKIEIGKIYTDAERELMLGIALTGEAFSHAIAERAPNYICENAYQLAVSFSKFYHDNHIVSEEDEEKKTAWINLLRLVKKMIVKHLDVLAIEPVERM
ncbi:MAG: arginine--tRNA ligase [Oscillospiraceae bacterium]|nr:arginine--tRNA ligase [Oscillospiraceae bacterium]